MPVLMVLLVLLSMSLLASDAAEARCAPAECPNMQQQLPASVRNAYGQQSPQTHSPQTYTPQTYSPQGYSPQGFAPQTGSSEAQNPAPPRLRLFRCVGDDDERNSCPFYSSRDLRSGNACTCNGSSGTIY